MDVQYHTIKCVCEYGSIEAVLVLMSGRVPCLGVATYNLHFHTKHYASH